MISLADLQRRIDAGDLSADAAHRAVARSNQRARKDHRRLCLPRRKRRARKAPGRCAASRSASRTSWTPRIFRPRWARRSTAVSAARRCGCGDAAEAGGCHHHRQDHDHGICAPRSDADAQSAQSWPYARRIVVGFGGGGGAGMIPLALGTQTGGSVIRPASFCGVAAIKPSYRLLPTVGVKCFSWTLDTVGLFAAGVEDLARGLSAMTGRPELLLPSGDSDAAHRHRDAGFCRGAGSGRRGGAADGDARPPSAPEPRCARWLCPK